MVDIQGLRGGAVAILILVFIVVIGIQIVANTQTAITDRVSSETVNESLGTIAANATVDIAGIGLNKNGFTVISIYNTTVAGTSEAGDIRLETTSFSVTQGDEIATINMTNASLADDPFHVDYSNSRDDETVAYNTTQDGLAAGAEFGNWFVIIVLVIVAVFIITLLLRGFGKTTVSG